MLGLGFRFSSYNQTCGSWKLSKDQSPEKTWASHGRFIVCVDPPWWPLHNRLPVPEIQTGLPLEYDQEYCGIADFVDKVASNLP